MTRSPADTLSLTLPSRSKSRARWRRPRKPTLWEVWYLAWMVLSVVFAVVDLIASNVISGVWWTGCAGMYWRAYQRERRGLKPTVSRSSSGLLLGTAILMFVLGVPG